MNLGLGISLRAFFGGDADMALLNMYFGDGSDGDVTVSGSVVLTRDMYYRNLTIAAGAALNTGGYRIFVSQTLDITAAPTNGIFAPVWDGGDAVATAAGTSVAPTGMVNGSGTGWNSAMFVIAGKAGGTTTGTAGTNTGSVNSVIAGGAPGTGGGTGGTGASGAGGAVGAFTAPNNYATYRYPLFGMAVTSPAPLEGGQSPSGGSGGGDGTAGGGSGGGGSGGVAVGIWAQTINRSSSNANAGVIASKGGRGGNGGVPAGGNRGGGGGSPGAGGGNIYIMCQNLIGSTHTNALDVSGGAGGAGGAGTGTGTAGQGGQAGFGGIVQVVNVGTNTVTVYNGRAVGGNANSGTTGGTSTAAQTSL